MPNLAQSIGVAKAGGIGRAGGQAGKARQLKQGIGHDAGIPHREDTAAVKCEYNELK